MNVLRKSSLVVLLSLAAPVAFAQQLRVAPTTPEVVPGARPGTGAVAPGVVPGATRPGSASSASSSRSQFSSGQVEAAAGSTQQATGSAATSRRAAPADLSGARSSARPAARSSRAAAPRSRTTVADRLQQAAQNRLGDYYGSEVAGRVASLPEALREKVTLQLSSIQASPADEALEKRAGAAVVSIAEKTGQSPYGDGLGLRECWETFGETAVTTALTVVANANDSVGNSLDNSAASSARLDGAMKQELGTATGRQGESLDQAMGDLQDPSLCGVFKPAAQASN